MTPAGSSPEAWSMVLLVIPVDGVSAPGVVSVEAPVGAVGIDSVEETIYNTHVAHPANTKARPPIIA
jgi:hypothetical protein